MSEIIISIIIGTIVGATPLVIAAVGGNFGEKAGVVNIGLEGNILMGAFAAAVGSYMFSSAWMGLLCAVVVGGVIALLHAYLCVTVKIDHVISGLAINIFAASISVFLLGVMFGSKGNSPMVPTLPSVTIPLLCDIPKVGAIFTNMSVITLLAPFIVIAAYLVFNKRKFGLHVKATGENMEAAKILGIKVNKVQYMSIIIGGVCCGLAGAFLSISNLNMYVRGMVAGRGYIAIATILFGRYKPVGIAFAGLFFGMITALQVALQDMINIPNEFIQAIPYVLTIVMVILVMAKKKETN